MEENMNDIEHNGTKQKSSWPKWAVWLLVIAMVGLLGYYAKGFIGSTANNKNTVNPGKMMYSNNAGLTLQIPSGLPLNTKADEADPTSQKLVLNINTQKISDLLEDAPAYGDRKTAEDDQAALAKGEFGSQNYGHPYAPSEAVQKLASGAYIKTFVSFGSGIDCSDVQVRRWLVAFNQGYRISISLVPNQDDLMAASPDYFTVDPQCSPDDKTKILTDTGGFYKAVSTGKLPGLANDWYTKFDEIVATLNLN